MDELMTAQEVADFYRVPLPTLYRWRVAGTGPRGARVGRHIRYDRRDVEQWIEARKLKKEGKVDGP
jgi:excisionase family DNA binding protein